MTRYYLGTADTPDSSLEPLEDEPCKACGGRGKMWVRARGGNEYVTCPKCGGTGTVEEDDDDA